MRRPSSSATRDAAPASHRSLPALHRATLLPGWPAIAERRQRDVPTRRRQIQEHGTLPTLTNLHSDITWRPRTGPGRPGRGLILAPCLFGRQRAHGGPGADAPTASNHATLPRDAGLVSTTRDGKSVRHELTDVGRRLVAVDGPATS